MLDNYSFLLYYFTDFGFELVVGSVKSTSYFTLTSEISETSASVFTFNTLLLSNINILSFNYECWNQTISETTNLLMTTPFIHPNVMLFQFYFVIKRQTDEVCLV